MIKRLIVLMILFVSSNSLILLSQEQYKVLVYTSPDLWHNPVIPTAITEFKKMAEKHFFALDWTQEASRFNEESLKDYSVLVFLQANGGSLSMEQMDCLKKFIRQGGGFVGIHATSVTRDQDEWFRKLVGRCFTGHPEKQTAVLSVVEQDFPACMHLNEQWLWTDEWYEFGEALTDHMKVILTVDESSYSPKRMVDGKEVNGMGDFHPISWYQEFDGGRSFYTALGHLEIHYTDPLFLDHIYGGIHWAATGGKSE